MPVLCQYCGRLFSRADNLEVHIRTEHNFIQRVHRCQLCGAVFSGTGELNSHRLTHEPSLTFEEIHSAHNRVLQRYRQTFGAEVSTLDLAYEQCREDMERLLRFKIEQLRNYKLVICFSVIFRRALPNSEEETIVHNIRLPIEEYFESVDISKRLDSAYNEIQRRLEGFIENGSSWVLQRVFFCDLDFYRCRPLVGRCGMSSIVQFEDINDIKSNPAAHSDNCFLRAVAYHFVQNSDVTVLDEYVKTHFKVNVPLPVKIRDVPKFERDNKIAINVLYGEDEFIPISGRRRKRDSVKVKERKVDSLRIIPLHKTGIESQVSVNLLLYQTFYKTPHKTGEVFSHYVYIQDVNKLLSPRYLRGNGMPQNKKDVLHCMNCLMRFWGKTGKDRLKIHEKSCSRNKPQAIEAPELGVPLEFKAFVKKTMLPIIGFFDFECVQEKIDSTEGDDSIRFHQAISYCLVIIDKNQKILHDISYTGKDAASHFTRTLLDIEAGLQSQLQQNVAVPKLSPMEQEQFDSSSSCWICERDMSEPSPYSTKLKKKKKNDSNDDDDDNHDQ